MQPIKTISNEQAFTINLPKWPALKLTGEPVTIDQAKEIIFRTDSFLVGLSEHAGGNNKKWNDWALNRLHYDLVFRFCDKLFGENQVPGLSRLYYDVLDEIRTELGFVLTSYISNDWLSSAYIFGPHGWCSPRGEICHTDNIGKWPSVEEVFGDFVKIANAFPFLKMTATLMSGEHSDDGIVPLITFVIRDGMTSMTDEHDKHHFVVTFPDRSDEAMFNRLKKFDSEQGIPNEWVLEYGEKFKPVMQHAARKLEDFIESAGKQRRKK